MKNEKYAVIAYLLLFVITSSFMLLLYHRYQQVEQYENIQSNLEQLKELDTQIYKDLLRNLSFYLSHYDTLAQLDNKTKKLQKKFFELSKEFSDKTPQFKIVWEQYLQQSKNKNQQLERIKSLSASIKNTLTYLPTAVIELEKKITDHNSYYLQFKVNQLISSVLQYNISHGHEKQQHIIELIQQLRHLTITENQQASLNNIITHVELNLSMKSQIEIRLRAYSQVNLGKNLLQLQNLHTDYFTQQNKNSYQINIILISLSASLFVFLGYVIRNLKIAHSNAKTNNARLYDALESIDEAFALFDHHNKLILWNQQFEFYYPKIKNYLKSGISYNELMYQAMKLGQFHSTKSDFGKPFRQDIVASSKELEYLADGRCYLASNSKTSSGGTACVRVDMTDQVKLEEKVVWQANFDALTRLPNRTLFLDRLSQTLKHSTRNDSLCALLFIDLDKFKEINDTLGHDIGDQLLILAAQRLAKTIRKADTVSRLGGDEFTIILQDITSAHDAANIATQILDHLESVFIIEGNEIHIGASIGITLFPTDAETPTQMLSNADISMYHAKEAGRNTYRFYTDEMNTDMLVRHQLEKDMRQAINREEFFLEYQPIIDSQSSRVFHAEALLRWQHPTHGRLAPDKFITLAEETGLIVPLGEWVLKHTIEQLSLWQNSGLKPLAISINVSSRQLLAGNFAKILQQFLHKTPLEKHSINLEMTESLLIETSAASHYNLESLKELGVKLSIDDFGTGFSSLSYLKQFPVDILKIDKSFIRDLINDPDDAILTSAIINLAHNFKLEVVAEGVETIEQLNFLKQHGCDFIQGFYYSKPLLPKAFFEFCTKQNINYNKQTQQESNK